MSASTATATTATADTAGGRVGRFAPSPTGPLHTGSVLAALGSWLDARAAAGRWLVRMEDLDTPRVVPGAAAAILRTLETLGLTWDGAVEYQSRNLEHYGAALADLRRRGLAYECGCSRRELAGGGERGYPGTCRNGPVRPGPTATRFRVEGEVRLDDRIQGRHAWRMDRLGDVVVRRRDGIFAYQLAVAVDDGRQGVTDVVRGADLLDSTPWQIRLQAALGLPRPRYAHLPVVVGAGGAKLSKSAHALPPAPARPGAVLIQSLQLLRQTPPPELAGLPPEAVLAWAQAHWHPEKLRGTATVPEPARPLSG